MTDMMEKLPTELMQEVMKYSDKPTIHSFTIVSSKYCEIARPLIFRRISIGIMTNNERFALFVEQMQNSSKLALMIKVLIISRRFSTILLRHLFEIVSNLEELCIQCSVDNSLLSPRFLPNLRRLHVPFNNPGFFNHIITNFIPRHEFLNVLKIPFVPTSPPNHGVTLSILPLASSAVAQLPHLRRIWLRSTHSRRLPAGVEAFITGIIELSAKNNRPLREIRLYAPGGNPSSHTYSKRSVWSHETGLPVKPFVS